MAITIKIESFPDIAKIAHRKALKAVRDRGLFEEITEGIIKDIRKGTNIATGHRLKALKRPTSDDPRTWRIRRKELAQFNTTHKSYGPNKSNLTFTGEFVNSIKGKIILGRSEIEIKPTGRHAPYRDASGKVTRKTRPRNIDIAEGQAAQGRNVLQITKKRKKLILKKVIKALKAFFS